MEFFEKYGELIQELYKIANPIIQFRIDKEILNKQETRFIHQYISLEDDRIKYWLQVYKPHQIHGRKDSVFENAIAKLLDFGLTKEQPEFHNLFGDLLEDQYWQEDDSFEGSLMKTVIYPFLIRAGYFDHPNVQHFFFKQLRRIEETIDKYGYDFEDQDYDRPKKYRDEFVFKIDSRVESLPTIYDLYAFAFYPRTDFELTQRLEKIVEFILDERFQRIPIKAYIFDPTKKQYYAAGNVYQACLIEKRKLLMMNLLSHFKAAGTSHLFMTELEQFTSMRGSDGFYEMDKGLLTEKKDSYHLYSGGHMGLGETRTNRNWRKIESTFWILKMLLNLERNHSAKGLSF